MQSGLAARVEEFQHALGRHRLAGRDARAASAADAGRRGALAGQLAQHAETLGRGRRDLAAATAVARPRARASPKQPAGADRRSLRPQRSVRGDARRALPPTSRTASPGRRRARRRSAPRSPRPPGARRSPSPDSSKPFATPPPRSANAPRRALQATIEQTNAQLSGALDQAADRFRQSVARGEGDGEPGSARARRDAAGTAPRRARSAAGDERDRRGDAAGRFRPDPGAEGACVRWCRTRARPSTSPSPSPLAARDRRGAGARFDTAPAARRRNDDARPRAPSPRETALARVAEAIASPVIEGPATGLIGSLSEPTSAARPRLRRSSRPAHGRPRRRPRRRPPARPPTAARRDGSRTCSPPPRATSRQPPPRRTDRRRRSTR